MVLEIPVELASPTKRTSESKVGKIGTWRKLVYHEREPGVKLLHKEHGLLIYRLKTVPTGDPGLHGVEVRTLNLVKPVLQYVVSKQPTFCCRLKASSRYILDCVRMF